MFFYLEKSLYEEYKKSIYVALEFFFSNNCAFSILYPLAYLYGALNRTFIEVSADKVSVNIDELNVCLPYLKQAIGHLEKCTIEHKIELTSIYNIFCKYKTMHTKQNYPIN